MSNFLQDLSTHYNIFTRSQKIIADYLTENLNDIAFCTLEELAEKIDVSTTTIIRFSRALGYTGYSEMQKDIQNNIQTKVGLPERLSSQKFYPDNTLLSDSFQNDIHNIQHTMATTVIKMNSGKVTEIDTNEMQKTAYEIGW